MCNLKQFAAILLVEVVAVAPCCHAGDSQTLIELPIRELTPRQFNSPPQSMFKTEAADDVDRDEKRDEFARIIGEYVAYFYQRFLPNLFRVYAIIMLAILVRDIALRLSDNRRD